LTGDRAVVEVRSKADNGETRQPEIRRQRTSFDIAELWSLEAW